MRPYEFKFVGRRDCVNQAEVEYLLDLDKVAAIGQPCFDESDGLAYVTLTFQGGAPLRTRFFTEYACTDPSVSTTDDRPMAVRKEIMRKTKADFIATVDALKNAWTNSPSTRGVSK